MTSLVRRLPVCCTSPLEPLPNEVGLVFCLYLCICVVVLLCGLMGTRSVVDQSPPRISYRVDGRRGGEEEEKEEGLRGPALHCAGSLVSIPKWSMGV
ncbi:hypothetical protein BDW42DRAFT_97894 [Aspergillus taichungensis]|uniref:Uncharacterized protein n=1 Tax=Aspergillus taichungensis TaxID=482145 RepID=A0A2J5HVZ3_9EURO|nr:hypothetical protein BDW42DRAFT_97894 [Aspergillus taichungensis]